jgi:Raf kinase inhibitor-like YbhB/YbcL family protein
MTCLVWAGAFIAVSRNDRESEGIIRDNAHAMSLTLTSPAFADGGFIPSPHTCDGDNVSPELEIGNIPKGTQSLVLVMDDPDIPVSVKQTRGISTFDHWVVYNIPPDTTRIPQGMIDGSQGLNTRGTIGYTGPCPPDREHRYFFRLYALSGTLTFIQTPTLHDVEEAAKGMMLESTSLTGRYERAKE